ncbi:MAG: hypothetical protein Q4P16_00855 [Spirochaetales bacterium]|nr:hypothetical protein [Spirochaetales bacterium]
MQVYCWQSSAGELSSDFTFPYDCKKSGVAGRKIFNSEKSIIQI